MSPHRARGTELADPSISHPAPVSALPPEEAIPTGKPAALEIQEGWFRYERTGPDVLKGLCFSVPQGTLYAIVGGNGSGKSTTLKTACGICKLYRGSVRIFGKPLQSYKGRLFGGCLSMLPQDPKCIFVKQTVLDDLKEMSGDMEKSRKPPGCARLTTCSMPIRRICPAAKCSGRRWQRCF